MSQTLSPALESLLANIIDYAGMFPPADLPCFASIQNYQDYRQHPQAWMLRWLVVTASEMHQVPAELKQHLSVLADEAIPGVAAIETKRIVKADQPVYCEVPVTELDAVKAAGCFAKIRTGSIKPEGIPSIDAVADFLIRCAERKLPFKATAGLHHPIRASYPLTYAADAPRAVMHGFVNVFLAAAFAWHGDRDLLPILQEEDPQAFRFDTQACWRDRRLTQQQIIAARKQFAHAFGSCSFLEPVQDLQARGWL
jgi:hypothetical protein